MSIRKNIKSTNLELTPEISDYLDKRLQSIEKLIDPNDTSAIFDVEVGKTTNHHKTGSIFRAEINLRIVGRQLRAVAEEESLFNAIDEARTDMVNTISRTKDKQRTLFKKGGATVKTFMQTLGTSSTRVRDFVKRKKK